MSTPASFTIDDVVDSAPLDLHFRRALPFTLEHEGMVLEDVPGDPGGATYCGITHDDYDALRHEHGLQLQELGKATASEIASCYFEHYWQPCQCAKMSFLVAFVVFDSAVLVGSSRPVRWLQAEIGVTVDGTVGPMTLAAIGLYVQKHGALALAHAVLDQRRSFHKAIVVARPGLRKFLKGWLKRVDDLKDAVDNASTT